MIEKVFENKSLITYKRGETICKQGAIANQVIQIKEGYAKAYIEHKNKNIIIRVLRAGDLIGLHNLFYDDTYNFTVAAINTCKVNAISFKALDEVLQSDTDFNNQIIGIINGYAKGYFNRFISLTQKQIHGRLADFIIHLSEEVYCADEFELHLSRKDIAEFTGMSTESAIRIIKEFHNDKIIAMDGKQLKITSMKLLKKLSDFG